MIDHAVLHPMHTDKDLEQAAAVADQWQVRALCVKPYHVLRAAALLTESPVVVCSVIGFPHGNHSTEVKIAEAREALEHGASELDMVVNIGSVVQGDWAHVHDEVSTIHRICREEGGLLKVIFETDFLESDTDKIRLCEICSEVGVAFVKTSTGFGFVKGKDGRYNYRGATEHDVRLMRAHCAPHVQVKASGGIKDLERVLLFRELGATRIGTSSTVEIMEEAKRKLG